MRIAIAGGGLGGLTLARILHRHGIDAVVYEREEGRSARSQGGMLDLHPESGQKALADAGLTGHFRSQARPEGEEHRILDPAGRALVHHTPEPGSFSGRPEIDRGALRDLLLDSLPDGTVAWHHRLIAATPRPSGGFALTFDGGRSADCEVLVGADGARSAVRPLLTDATLSPVATLVELSIADADRRHPELAELVGPGNLWCIGVSQILAAQRQGDGSIRVGISLPADDRPLDAYRGKRALLAMFDGWAPASRHSSKPPTARPPHAGSRRCPPRHAGPTNRASPSSATPPTSCRRSARAPTKPCSTPPHSPPSSPPTPPTPTRRSRRTRRRCSPGSTRSPRCPPGSRP
nr:FAD-dependent monooxygenase [Phytohabitans houttuyneae]